MHLLSPQAAGFLALAALIHCGAPALLAAYAIRRRQPVKIKAGRFEFENLPDKEPREPPEPIVIRKFPDERSEKRRVS